MCGKVFDKKRGLSSHARFCKQAPVSKENTLSATLPPPDTEASSLVCNKCEKSFKSIQALRTHERFCKGKIETVKGGSERRLSMTLPVNCENICTVCGDIIATPTGLKVHMLSHRK